MKFESVPTIDPKESLKIGEQRDRTQLNPEAKLNLICSEIRTSTGADPRSGGWAFVGRPNIVLQLMRDFGALSPHGTSIRLERPVIVGQRNADIIGWWHGMPIRVRGAARGGSLFCLQETVIPNSLPVDRKQAGRMRMAAVHGKLAELADD